MFPDVVKVHRHKPETDGQVSVPLGQFSNENHDSQTSTSILITAKAFPVSFAHNLNGELTTYESLVNSVRDVIVNVDFVVEIPIYVSRISRLLRMTYLTLLLGVSFNEK